MSTNASSQSAPEASQQEIRTARRWKIFLLVGLVSLVADQATKIWARTLPSRPGSDGYAIGIPQVVIENFFDWQLSFNKGSAFSLFGEMQGARVFLTVVGLLAVGIIIWMAYRARDDQSRLIWALGLVIGGAVGNLADRIIFGAVTDFVVWKYYDARWPTFNVADAALVIGVGLMLVDMVAEAKAEIRAQKAAAASAPPPSKGKGQAGGKKKKRR